MVHRVLIVHNAYQQRGGEDTVVQAEEALLRSQGHAVEIYTRSNADVATMNSANLAATTLWSRRTRSDIAACVARFQPDVIHAHNTFPLISPSLYWAASRADVPVVQTLHNFRLLCLNALFLREGKVCEDCLGQLPWRGVSQACYRGSAVASAALAGMLALHRRLGTYRKKITRYIALNEFCRRKFIAGGLPAERVMVKPNFVDAGVPETMHRAGLLFVGRLSVEKGIATLAEAMQSLPGVQLRVAGDGPEAVLLEGMAGVSRLGSLPAAAVRAEMNGAVALVVPSIWYETFGLVVIEAFASGTPVIASRIGALADIVTEGETGLLFEPGNPRDLADKIAWALANPARMAEMGRRARVRYEAEFSAEVNYRQLIGIYEEAIAATRSEGTHDHA